MKKVLLAACLVAIFSFIPKAPHPSSTYRITLSLTLSQYQSLLATISQSQVMSANDASALNQLILSQLNPQIIAQNKQDSIEAAREIHDKPKSKP